MIKLEIMKTIFYRYSIFVFLIGLFISTNSVAQENDASNYRMLFKLVQQNNMIIQDYLK